MTPLNKLFDITYGNKLDLNKLNQISIGDGGINFVGRSSQNHGVSGIVEKLQGVEPFEGGLITVALGGTKLLASFVQEKEFYTAQNVAVLSPKVPMTFQQKLYICLAITHNRFRYSAFGREANRSLRTLLVPDISEIPEWINQYKKKASDDYRKPLTKIAGFNDVIDVNSWKSFRYDEIFEIKKGYYNKKPPVGAWGDGIPFIGATESRNGISAYISLGDIERYAKYGSINEHESLEKKLFSGKCITVSNNGSVGEAFYQPHQFTCTHDVNPLYLKDKSIDLTGALGLFLCSVIRLEKYRWSYGRKWRPMRMPDSIIKLPVTKSGKPDWAYMENYMKTLPYSSQIKE